MIVTNFIDVILFGLSVRIPGRERIHTSSYFNPFIYFVYLICLKSINFDKFLKTSNRFFCEYVVG
uniref:Uncharacterized protein n=1 Tax=Solanum lycopersicum TaxID=4081 RepID=A0A494G8F7_SOLLC